MTIGNHIEDPRTGQKAAVIDGVEKNALAVATRRLKTLNNITKFFSTTAGSVELNIDGSAGGTPLKVHNGGDDVLWTGSSIVGTGWDFADTAQNHTPAGSASFSGTLLNVGDLVQFARGSSLDLTGYQSLTMWVYISANWLSGDKIDIFGWNTGTGSQVGSQIDLSNYINTLNVGVWQQANIPLGDLELVGETIDSLRIGYGIRDGAKVSFYIDDIQFEETGGGIEFFIRPNNSTWLTIKTIKIIMADAYDSTITDGTVSGISYNGFLGLSTLSAGILFQQVQDGEITSITFRDLFELLQFASTDLIDSGYDGTDTWITVKLQPDEGILLKANKNDYMRIVIFDNLEGLKKFRVTADCVEEIRNIDGTFKDEKRKTSRLRNPQFIV
jgi:hypothetical protein